MLPVNLTQNKNQSAIYYFGERKGEAQLYSENIFSGSVLDRKKIFSRGCRVRISSTLIKSFRFTLCVLKSFNQFC